MKPDNQKKTQPEKIADFETAISFTGFGLYNLLLILIAFPSTITSQFETTAMAYVFPAAQCDLNLTLENKGLLNAIVFGGMVMSGCLFGILTDIFGRRKILIIGYSCDALFALITTFAPSFSVILMAKFMGGFIINGPSSALPTYLSEFHGKKYRSRVPMVLGFHYSLGNICLPLLAWLVLPLDVHVPLFGGAFVFHAWNIYLFLCVIPPLIATLIYVLMPETPKFLMTKGDNDKALEVFQNIYSKNTRQPKQNYPVRKLIDEHKSEEGKKRSAKEALRQIRPLFTRTHLPKLVLVCFVELSFMMSINTIRLWLPQIFQIINDYEQINNGSSTFCTMLDTLQTLTDTDPDVCSVNLNNASVYINSVIIGAVTMVGYITTGIIINSFGRKKILCVLSITAGASAISVYFAANTPTALALLCVNITCSCICIDILTTIIIDLFPTFLRASALSIGLLCGRMGALLGNLVFPLLLRSGCAPPFFTLGFFMIGSGLVSLFLPNIDLKSLE